MAEGTSSTAPWTIREDDVAHSDVQYWVQRLTVSIARWTARHILDGIAAEHGMPSHSGHLPAGLTTAYWPSSDAVGMGGTVT